MVDYGERLKKAMDDENVSVQALADYLGVSYQAVKKVLDGKTKSFNAPHHEDTCLKLKVSGRWLAKGEGDSRPLVVPSQVQPLSTGDEWLVEGQKILAGLKKEDRRAAVLQLRVFVAQLHTPGNSQDLPVAA
jgi:transcriptional regulator with XRE-family HTH domain